MSTPLARARAHKTAEDQFTNDISVEALARMELDDMVRIAAEKMQNWRNLQRRVRRYYAVYMNEVAATVDEMDADHDGVIDEHSWEQIRASASSEPSLDALVWDMDNAKLEVDTIEELCRNAKANLTILAARRASSRKAHMDAQLAIDNSGCVEAIAAAQRGMEDEEAAQAKAEATGREHAKAVANKAIHGYVPPRSGVAIAAQFFGNNGIYPTKVPLEVHDMRMHRPLGYRYHARAQVEAPPEIQSDNKSIFIAKESMPRAHSLALNMRGSARPGYPYLRSYEWPAD